MPPRFDAATLAMLGRVREVQLETTSLDGAQIHRTTIWVVTVGHQVFVRSERGTAGRWYREARQQPDLVLHAEAESIPVSAVLAPDPDIVQEVSDAFTAKYRRLSQASTASMLRPHTLETTMRLDPAGDASLPQDPSSD